VLLIRLSEAIGVSGFEDEVRRIIRDEVSGYVDELFTDTMGNLFAVKRGEDPRGPKVMLAAHMDEVGLLVDMIEQNGMIRFRKVGGIDNRVLLSRRVVIGEKKVPGVIGAKPIHIQKAEERNKVVDSDDMFIDIGATSKEEAERLVKVGDPVGFSVRARTSGDIVVGKAFDDRAGCAALVEILKMDRCRATIYGVFTVQEEVGLRGSRVAAFRIDPDYAFVIEGTTAWDIPEKRDVSPVAELGRGPAITIADAGMISDRGLVELLMRTGDENGIRWQVKRSTTGSTDGASIQRTREGVRTVTVSVPVRYVHAPVGMLDMGDFRATAELVYKSLLKLGGG
jgi:endoglucanase